MIADCYVAIASVVNGGSPHREQWELGNGAEKGNRAGRDMG